MAKVSVRRSAYDIAEARGAAKAYNLCASRLVEMFALELPSVGNGRSRFQQAFDALVAKFDVDGASKAPSVEQRDITSFSEDEIVDCILAAAAPFRKSKAVIIDRSDFIWRVVDQLEGRGLLRQGRRSGATTGRFATVNGLLQKAMKRSNGSISRSGSGSLLLASRPR